MRQLEFWCKDNNYSLTVIQTKEMTVDFRRTQMPHTPLHISSTAVETVPSFRNLGEHITYILFWSLNQ